MPVACYLDQGMTRRSARRNVRLAAKYLKRHRKLFDGLVCRGVSGLAFAGPLGYLLNVPVVVVRKPGARCHSGNIVEGEDEADRLVFVDDTICSGSTVAAVRRELEAEFRRCPENGNELGKRRIVGVYLYDGGAFAGRAVFGDSVLFCALSSWRTEQIADRQWLPGAKDDQYIGSTISWSSLLTRVPNLV